MMHFYLAFARQKKMRVVTASWFQFPHWWKGLEICLSFNMWWCLPENKKNIHWNKQITNWILNWVNHHSLIGTMKSPSLTQFSPHFLLSICLTMIFGSHDFFLEPKIALTKEVGVSKKVNRYIESVWPFRTLWEVGIIH